MKNFWLTIKNWFRYITKSNKLGKFKPSKNQVEEHDFTIFTDEDITNLYHKGFLWGKYHPDKKWAYFDGDFYKLDNEKGLSVIVKYEPRTYDNMLMPYGNCVLRTKESYKYGYFEASIKLPKEKNTWPAFWMTGIDSWPPEIDILEAYNRDGSYKKNKKLQTNIHYKLPNECKDKHITGKDHPIPNNVDENYNLYGVLWTKDEISFYYNRHLVRTVTDKEQLATFNQPLEIIISTGLIDNTGDKNVHSEMYIKSLDIWQ